MGALARLSLSLSVFLPSLAFAALGQDCVNCGGGRKPAIIGQSASLGVTKNMALDSAGLHSKGNKGQKKKLASATREFVTNSGYPWRTIGKVNVNGGSCTGTLIGECYVATAFHCVYDSEKKKSRGKEVSFQGNFSDEEVAADYWMYDKAQEKKPTKGGDWAILRLTKSVGNELGWMAVAKNATSSYSEGDPFKATGYNADLSATKLTSDNGVNVIELKDGGVLKTDARIEPGTSGGPLWRMEDDEAVLYGVNVDTWKESKCLGSGKECAEKLELQRGGWATAPENFREKFEEMQQEYPCH